MWFCACQKRVLIDGYGKYLGEYEYRAEADFQDPRQRFRSFIAYNESGNYVYGLMRAKNVLQTSLQGSFPSSDLVFLAELTLYGKYHIIPERLFFRRYHSEQSTKGALNIERARTGWFDTSLESKIVLPKWQALQGDFKAVKNAPINSYKRLYCYLQIMRWALVPAHVRALGKDMALASWKILVTLLLRIRNGKNSPAKKPI